MDAEWIKSSTARRIIAHWSDARPAWLWAHDGQTLLWRNEAARFFLGKVKKHGVRFMPEPVPIRGQIARLLRLGSMGRSSLSRIQLLAGEKPISMTCTCTPLDVAGQGLGLLIVGVDPIDPELLGYGEGSAEDPLVTALLPEGADYLLVNEDSQITGGSPHALATYAEEIESEGLPRFDDGDSARVTMAGTELTLTRFVASPHEAMLLLFAPAGVAVERPTIADVRDAEGMDAEIAYDAPDRDEAPQIEPPASNADAVTSEDDTAPADEAGVAEDAETAAAASPGSLASLFDRLADDDGLYGALSAADETYDGPPPPEPERILRPEDPDAAPEGPVAIEDPGVIDLPPASEPEDGHDVDVIGALIEYADEEEATGTEAATPEPAATSAPEAAPDQPDPETEQPDEADATEAEAAGSDAPVVTWRVIGRGFVARHDETRAAAADEGPSDAVQPSGVQSDDAAAEDAPSDDVSAEIVPFVSDNVHPAPGESDELSAVAQFAEDGAADAAEAEHDAAGPEMPDEGEPHETTAANDAAGPADAP